MNDNPERFSEADIRAVGVSKDIRIISHDQNRGLSAARNTGIAESSGEQIGFLDSDDYYVTNGLARHLDLAERSGADLTHAQSFLARGASPAVHLLPRDAMLHGQPTLGKSGLARMEEAQFFVSSWSSLYRRDFLDRCSLRFDEAQTRFEDRLFVLQSVTAARSIARLAEPVRVWRRRAGSISTSATDFPVHLLQVQLLEKCMAHMRQQVKVGLPPRFLKRELFNSVGRLIWDMDLLDRLIWNDDPTYADLAQRVVNLLGPESFHAAFFNDPIIRKISRVNQPSRRGRIDRGSFFALHAAIRAGDFASLRQILPKIHASAELATMANLAAPARIGPGIRPLKARLVLHLGMHKTASTYVQGQLQANAAALLSKGILIPQTGIDGAGRAVTRPGGFAGHVGLLSALKSGDTAIWSTLATEVRKSGAHTVILSCENMLLPFEADRPHRLHHLMKRLSMFSQVQPIAMVRRPDRAVEALWRELAGNGRRAGARSLPEFLVDHLSTLTHLPALFAPFEEATGQRLRLADFDANAAAVWPAFLALAGIDGQGLAEQSGVARYPTPSAVQIALVRTANALIPAEDLRIEVLQALFRMPWPASTDRSFLSPAERLAVVDQFCTTSQDWAAARGYCPDLAQWRADLLAEDWQPPPPPDSADLERLLTARMMAERSLTRPLPAPEQNPPRQPDAPMLTIRLRRRPWLTRLLQRITPPMS